MAGEDVRKVSRQDLEFVTGLIDGCLQMYMNKEEVVDELSHKAKIEPSFIELVWQQLERERPAYFKAYYLRLMLKNQIYAFNKLLENQYQLMIKDYSSGVPSMPLPNGSNSNTLKQNSCFLPESATTAMQNGVMRNGSSSGVVNGTQSSDQLMYTAKDIHGLHSGLDASTSLLLAQNASPVLFGADNGTTIKTESGYSSNAADFAFCRNAFLESCQSIGDASGGSFSSSELNGQPLNDSILENESSPFDFLNQIPPNFNFADFTEGFNQSAEILDNYGNSPFLSSEPNNFSDSTGGEHTG